ncbi:hypothetical protein O1611_g4699 [Lasiodiplodia mahajangana]|uniref:Uncharacterized protein n=1 Tax=Lasiodiplodia mahajangana TaxID=1108764 RepID=A0ACC2JN42_9PEZI|nr:hypothetical protein O1611_g4699 [Lasiodiplodia mahajangana]
MDIFQPTIHELQHFAPGLSPAVARHRYRKSPRGRGLQVPWHNLKRHQRAPRVGWDRDEGEDGHRLASDPTVILPGERLRPRLKRQEAFRAPQTWDISDTDIAVSDAELYRLGILYNDDDDDDENQHVRSSGFCLDAIVHKEPVYSLRPAKRVKRTHSRRLPLGEDDLHLSVELLSAYLGDDAAIAQFFTPVSEDESPQLHGEEFYGVNTRYGRPTTRRGSVEALTVIYELDEDSAHSLAPTPSDNDFPELISDTEDDEADSFGGDWALVLDPSTALSKLSDDVAQSDTDVDVILNHDEEATDAANGAWVFLAGDDS